MNELSSVRELSDVEVVEVVDEAILEIGTGSMTLSCQAILYAGVRRNKELMLASFSILALK